MFLNDAFRDWEREYAGTITPRCPIADVLLAKLGHQLEQPIREKVRYCECLEATDGEAAAPS